MHRNYKVILLTLLLISASQSAFAAAGDWTFSATNWIRGRVVNKDLQETNKTTDAGFSLDRGYLRYAYQFTDTIKGQWSADFYSAKTSDVKDGAGIKLKEGYVDFPFFLPETKLTVGLQKNYLGLIYDYDYRIIEKEFIDKNGIDSSADIGIILNGHLPQGYGSYKVGIYNGEGYKKELSPDINTEPAAVADIRVIPLPGFTVGGSYKYELQGIVSSTGNNAYTKNNLATAMLRATYSKFDAWAEYIDQITNAYNATTSTFTNVKKKGFSIIPSYQITPAWTILARYDLWDPDTAMANDKITTLIAGVNYTVTKGILLQLNYQTDNPENSAKSTTTQYLAQIAWTFSRTFSQ